MDRAAFEGVFADYAPRVRAYFLRHGLNRSLADEVVQEVMLTVWRESERFDPAKGSLSTWVFTIARNRLIDSVRRQKRPEPDPTDPCWSGDPDARPPSPEAAAAAASRARNVQRALLSLPPEQRRVVEALYFEGQTMSELSAASGVPLGTIKTRARLALRALRGNVEGETEE